VFDALRIYRQSWRMPVNAAVVGCLFTLIPRELDLAWPEIFDALCNTTVSKSKTPEKKALNKPTIVSRAASESWSAAYLADMTRGRRFILSKAILITYFCNCNVEIRLYRYITTT